MRERRGGAQSWGPVVAHDVTTEGEALSVVMWRQLQGNGGAAARLSEVRLLVHTHSVRKHRRADGWQADPQPGRKVGNTSYKVSTAI